MKIATQNCPEFSYSNFLVFCLASLQAGYTIGGAEGRTERASEPSCLFS